MRFDAQSQRRKGGLSDSDNKGCGRLTIVAETDIEREWLTAIYFLNAPVLPRNEKHQRELAAIQLLQKWLSEEKKALTADA